VPLLAIWVGAAHAQTLDGLTLHWHAPDGCPDDTEMLARIRAHLPSGHRSPRGWSVEVRIANEGARYSMELVLRNGESHARRMIASESCAALADAAALLVALAVDPQAAAAPDPKAAPEGQGEAGTGARNAARAAPSTPARTDSSRSEPQGGNAVDAGERRAPSLSPAPAQQPREDQAPAEAPDTAGQNAIGFGWDFGAAIRLDSGMLPQTPALGLQPQLGLTFGKVSGRIGMTVWLEADTPSESYPRATLEGRALLGDAALCLELVRATISFAPCAVGELGELVLESRGVSNPGSSAAVWAAAGGGMRAGYPMAGGLWATLDVLVLAPFSRPRWLVRTMQGDAELFTATSATIRVALGLSYAFERFP
jgi:hypothetical protein